MEIAIIEHLLYMGDCNTKTVISITTRLFVTKLSKNV